MVVSEETVKKILLKMTHPIHFSYISNYILKCSEEETLKFLNKLVDEGLIKEVKFDGYYVMINYKGLK